MMFKVLIVLLWPFRMVTGTLIRLGDRATRPTPAVRAPEAQAKVDRETKDLILYHFQACPFCVKVRRQIRRLGLNIEMRDIKVNPTYAEELVKGGGEYQAPCLLIKKPGLADQWMYESSDINAYLESRFAS